MDIRLTFYKAEAIMFHEYPSKKEQNTALLKFGKLQSDMYDLLENMDKPSVILGNC